MYLGQCEHLSFKDLTFFIILLHISTYSVTHTRHIQINAILTCLLYFSRQNSNSSFYSTLISYMPNANRSLILHLNLILNCIQQFLLGTLTVLQVHTLQLAISSFILTNSYKRATLTTYFFMNILKSHVQHPHLLNQSDTFSSKILFLALRISTTLLPAMPFKN